MLMAAPVDERLVESNRAQTRAFRAGAALSPWPIEPVDIPFEDTTRPGYVMTVDDTGVARATVVLLGGYDGTAEELYFMNGAAALARGYNVVALDGPGQGGALLQQGLTLRPDWDAVMVPVLDWVLARPDVDERRVALIGLSMGAFLGPRTAATERRIAALIADCGSFDMFDGALERMPADSRRASAPVRRTPSKRWPASWPGSRTTPPPAGRCVAACWCTARHPCRLRRCVARVHVAPVRGADACPTLVCSAESDHISASAGELVAALTCRHEHLRFTDAEGAGDHCEAGARTLYHARTFEWLDGVLRVGG